MKYRSNPDWGAVKVRLLHNGDWGERKERRFMWVTIVDLDMSSGIITSWCPGQSGPGRPTTLTTSASGSR